MSASDEELRRLLRMPRESLDLELKRWLDPQSNEGIAKLAKGCMALRNNNGGRFVVGFQDDGRPDTQNAPPDVRAAFHTDVVQSIVSRYSSEMFAVDVQYVDVGGQFYPVITVPSGVRTPVAAKRDLPDPAGGAHLIRDNAVYVRSLNSNNTVSSTEARRGDWDRLTRSCFDNREADIGGFVRRHLSGLDFEALRSLAPVFAGMVNRPTDRERVTAELDRGHERFLAVARSRQVPVSELGTDECVVLVNGTVPERRPTQSFLRSLNAPHYSGWPPWVNLSGGGGPSDQPYVFEDAFEAFVHVTNLLPVPSLDFWRIEPRGVFYLLRALVDDLAPEMVQRGTQLDFSSQVSQTAEVIATGLAFARALGCDEAATSLTFGFRWRKLAGRMLTSWADQRRRLRWARTAKQDEIVTVVNVPLETPATAVAPHVGNAVAPLFALFDGTEFDAPVIEGIVAERIERRM